MNLVDELQKIKQLHDNGTLSSAEYAQYKAKLWKKSGLDIPNSSSEDFIQQMPNEKLEVLAQLDREWKKEKLKFMRKDRYGNKRLITKVYAIFMTLISIFLIVVSILTFAIPRTKPAFESFDVIRILYLVFMFPVSIYGLWEGIQQYQKAGKYQIALINYQTKRDQILHS
jgi:hypothetical protein